MRDPVRGGASRVAASRSLGVELAPAVKELVVFIFCLCRIAAHYFILESDLTCWARWWHHTGSEA